MEISEKLLKFFQMGLSSPSSSIICESMETLKINLPCLQIQRMLSIAFGTLANKAHMTAIAGAAAINVVQCLSTRSKSFKLMDLPLSEVTAVIVEAIKPRHKKIIAASKDKEGLTQ